jgi:hypothetical protein
MTCSLHSGNFHESQSRYGRENGSEGMHPNLPVLDRTIFRAVNGCEKEIESTLNCHCLLYIGEIRMDLFRNFRDSIERLKNTSKIEGDDKNAIAICLKTPGGEVEIVEKMVDVLRHHYKKVYFIVPDAAFSAGTVFCMSGDKIFMDYSSSLGPIDPQVPDNEGKYLVPALGYLDKVEEIIKKSIEGTISPAEIALLEKMDLAMLRLYEQAKELSIKLLETWLAEYKFRDWIEHRTTNIGQAVTPDERRQRAKEIGSALADNKRWHSHGRAINMKTLQNTLKLDIDDLAGNAKLHKAVRKYNDILSDWLIRWNLSSLIYNRRLHQTAKAGE